MTNKQKQNLLVVSPYGIGMRELFLYPHMSAGLRETFNIDVYTGLEFDDLPEWGIREIIPVHKSGLVSRIAHAIDHRFIWIQAN